MNADKKALCVVSNLPVEMKRKMILEAVKKGKFFSVSWVTKNGKISEMNCRNGVKKHLKNTGKVCSNGTSNTVAHLSQYLTVYKVNAGDKNGYRNLNLDTVLILKVDGNTIHFSG